MKKLSDMQKIHKIGADSRAAVLRTCLQWGGMDISVSFAFGLGCGYGFTYMYPKGRERPKALDLPEFYVLGNNDRFIEDFCANVGIGIIEDRALMPENAWQGVINHIRQGKPVLVNVNYGLYAEFLRERKAYRPFDDPGTLNIGGLKVLVIDYIPEKEKYVILDGLQNDSVILDKKDFELIRQARYDLQEFQWQSLEIPSKFYDLEYSTRYAVAKTAWKMLNPSIETYGLSALQKFTATLKEDKLKQDETDWLVYFSGYRQNEGFYRRSYARFLEEAADFLNQSELGGLAGKASEAADLWQSVLSDLLSNVPAPSKLLDRIYQLESELTEALQSITEEWGLS